jgi:hypothetical protein
MENLIESIRIAITAEASDEARVAGIVACRTILAQLEPPASQPTTPPIAPFDASQIASAVATLRGVPAEQLLDLAIARLRAALPAGTEVPTVQPLKFQMIAVDPLMPKRTP